MGLITKEELERSIRTKNSRKTLTDLEKDLNLVGSFGDNIRNFSNVDDINIRFIAFMGVSFTEGIDKSYYPGMVDSHNGLGSKFRRNLAKVCVAMNPMSLNMLKERADILMDKALSMLKEGSTDYHRINIEKQFISTRKSTDECIKSLGKLREQDPSLCKQTLIDKSIRVACLTHEQNKINDIYKAAGSDLNNVSKHLKTVQIERQVLMDEVKEECLFDKFLELPEFRSIFVLQQTENLTENWIK